MKPFLQSKVTVRVRRALISEDDQRDEVLTAKDRIYEMREYGHALGEGQEGVEGGDSLALEASLGQGRVERRLGVGRTRGSRLVVVAGLCGLKSASW